MQWNGTCDWSPFLSTLAALDFRKSIGGEERITEYCHNLAVEGGELIAKILGTEVMRNAEGGDELIANMASFISLRCGDENLSAFDRSTFDYRSIYRPARKERRN